MAGRSDRRTGQLAFEWAASSSSGVAEPPRKRRRKPGPPPVPSLESLQASDSEVQYLWWVYRVYREHIACRDRLVEFYMPWAAEVAYGIALKMRLQDADDAVGEALQCFAIKIVPSFNGRGDFHAYARVCMQRRLVDLYRRGRREVVMIKPAADSERNWIEEHVEATQEKRGVNFRVLVECLPENQRQIIRLRFEKYLSAAQVSEILGCSLVRVKRETRKAIAAIRQRWPELDDDLLAG